MLLLQTERLPEGSNWAYELKLDGYRALAIKTGGKVHLRSRNDNDFNLRYPAVVQALGALPDETVIDGEVVALDETGRPSFNTLQNCGSAKASVFYYVFDVAVHGGRNVMSEPLSVRRELLRPSSFEYRCPLKASSCVLSQKQGRELLFYSLDPVRGKGRLLGKTDRWAPRLLSWASDVSPDGSRVAVVSSGNNILTLANGAWHEIPVDARWGTEYIAWRSEERRVG